MTSETFWLDVEVFDDLLESVNADDPKIHSVIMKHARKWYRSAREEKFSHKPARPVLAGAAAGERGDVAIKGT